MRAICLVLTLAAILTGQNPEPRFEVTSVKVNTLPAAQRTYSLQCSLTGQLHSTANELTRLVLWAYDLPPWEVIWQAKFDRAKLYDIEAVAGRDVTQAECRAMLQSVLVDRFQLRVHREKKVVPIYALVKSEKGLALVAAKDSDKLDVAINGNPLRVPGDLPNGWTMRALSDLLNVVFLDRPVVDRTGLNGVYKIALNFEAGPPGMPLPGNDPDIFDALRQMGLSLEKRDDPLDVLFIDAVALPDPN